MKKIILFVVLSFLSLNAFSIELSCKKIDTNFLLLDVCELTSFYSIHKQANPIVLQNQKANNFPISRGGAITSDGHKLLIATHDGRFYKLDEKEFSEFLPKIETNNTVIDRSKRYSVELEPRVLDFYFYNKIFYVSYIFYDANEDKIFFKLDRSFNKSKWENIYTSTYLDAPYFTPANGGKLIGYGTKLLVTIGDQSLERKNGLISDFAAQNLSVPWGKILQFDTSNIFKQPTIFSIGHRNPQGLLLHSNGQILETEHGPKGGDEINLIQKGGNYGWPFSSQGAFYNTYKLFSSYPPPEGACDEVWWSRYFVSFHQLGSHK